MRCPLEWTPVGCGAAAVTEGDAAPQAGSSLIEELVLRAERVDLGPEMVFLAWEIASLAVAAEGPDRKRPLMLLVLALLAASAEGSTRLDFGEGRDLDRLLGSLEATDAELAEVRLMLDEARGASSASPGEGLAAVIGGAGDYRPLIMEHGCVYIQKLHVLEARVGAALRRRIEPLGEESECVGIGRETEDALREVFESPPEVGRSHDGEEDGARRGGADGSGEGASCAIVLDEEQKQAVRAAMSGRLTVISGRPGSGKTSIVASILRALARVGSVPLESMALAAPTGKAADRLRQSIESHLASIPTPADADRRLAEACPPSSTLHRLLGYSPVEERFWHNEHNPLSEELVIVDESSMIDLAMMDRLLRALRDEARLVLLGDADQLPSVDAGAVLRELCSAPRASERGRVSVLEKSYRAREDSSGKAILDVARAINEGVSPGSAAGGRALKARTNVSDVRFEGVEHLSPGGVEQRRELFSAWMERLWGELPDLEERLSRDYEEGPAGFDDETIEALRVVLSHFERYRILSVTRVPAGGAGAEAVNAFFHRRRLDLLRRRGEIRGSHLLVGEPVIVTRNDYTHRLYNGDSGLVLNVAPRSGSRRRTAEPMAVFPRGGGFVAYPLETLRGKLEPAWATTVHKSQGSEYDHVAVLLPEVPVRTLTRELLYTAVTRAKKSVVIAGSSEVLQSGVSRRMERASGLADALG